MSIIPVCGMVLIDVILTHLVFFMARKAGASKYVEGNVLWKWIKPEQTSPTKLLVMALIGQAYITILFNLTYWIVGKYEFLMWFMFGAYAIVFIYHFQYIFEIEKVLKVGATN